MNKWLYRAVGAVGVASGALLMGSVAAHAEPVTQDESSTGPQEMHSLVADLFTPTGGQRHLSLDPQDDRTEIIGGLLGGGSGGALGGLLGGSSGGGPLGSLLGGAGGGPLGGLLGGNGGPLGSLPLGGLIGGDGGPLGGLTGGLTGGGGPLGGLTGGGGPLGGLLGGGGTANADREPSTADPSADAQLDLLLDTADPAVRAILGDADLLNRIGVPGPASTDIVDPALRGTALDTSNVQPIVLGADASQQIQTAASDLIPALIADAVAQQAAPSGTPADDLAMQDPLAVAPAADDLLDADLNDLSDLDDLSLEAPTEGLPLVGSIPLVGPLLGPGGPLDQVLVVGDIAKNLPVVGGLAAGDGLDLDTLDNLPIVSGLLQQGLIKGGDAADHTGLPLVGSLPLLGGALNSMTSQLTSALPTTPLQAPVQGTPAGTPASDNPMAMPGAGAAQHTAPRQQAPATSGGLVTSPAADEPVTTVPARQPSRQINAPVPAPAQQHAAPERPVAGIDAEYAGTEMTQAPSLPLLGSLTGDLTGALTGGLGGGQAGVGTLPVSSLIRQLPLVSDLPLISQLPVPLQLLRSMPVVGLVADLLPVESGTAA